MGRTLVSLLCLAATAAAGDVPRKEPGPKSRGKVYAWEAANGGQYLYYVPKGYDPDEGANLVFLLHGSNGNRFWGMANCPVGKGFREDDIIVSPDGSQKGGGESYNRTMEPAELEYLHVLHAELKRVFEVRQTFLYGHSQGAFFSYHYACSHPDEVDGVVAMAGNVWSHTPLGDPSKKIAFVVMHGTQDPVVPYGAGVGAMSVLKDAGYPKARFRTLEGWNHWPTDYNSRVPHTAQQLAWCEGMTTDDPERLEESLEFLLDCKVKEHNDYAAIYTLAERVAATEAAPAALRKRAESAMGGVQKLVEAHVAALKPDADRAFDGEPWIAHLPMVLRGFPGVPAREELAKEWDPVLEAHRDAAVPRLRAYYDAMRKNDAAAAFPEGVAAIREGFLLYECADREFLNALENLRKESKDLPRDAVKEYDRIVPAFEKALKEGERDYLRTNAKARL